MGIKELLQRWKDNRQASSAKFKEMQEEQRLQKMLEERQKSANQRELERYMRDQKEKMIKEELEKIHTRQNKENWKGNNFGGKATMLKDDRPILKEKNIFLDKKSKNPVTQRRMYFK